MKNLLIASALAFALFSAPVVAQECVTLEAFAETVAANGGEIYGGAEYPGTHADYSVIYSAAGFIFYIAFKGECAIMNPLALDEIAPSKPQSSPALKAPKAEVQS